ncbi:GBS Bsp-like repeat-containing protein [Paenibacillus oleatilyticus]|uniref:GBS Bsp-like repeat-containing protein n=1 Tax=Paenibacillus oleatilyticus TaxID=2594886 RepID=A0ABV4VB76_9BACL
MFFSKGSSKIFWLFWLSLMTLLYFPSSMTEASKISSDSQSSVAFSVHDDVYDRSRFYSTTSINVQGVVYGNTLMDPRTVISSIHTNSTGYKYSYDKSGRMTFVTNPNGSIQIVTYDNNGNLMSKKNQPTPGVSIPAQIDASTASYDIYVFGVSEVATKVEFPTWTEHNGQDDLEFPQGEKVAEGVWKATILLSKHNNETGTYLTHIYIDSTISYMVSTQVNPAAVKVRAPKDVNLSAGSYDIYVDGVSNQVAKVLFPTWTEYNGQDDLENPWIQGTQVSENTWKITIPFSKHNYEPGKYFTDVYAEDVYGNRVLIAWRSITTAHGSVGIPSQVDLSSPSYDIYVYGIAKGATKVEFPTWTENNGQDDIEWLQGQKVTEGVWKATISLNKHNNETGNYITHIYIDGAIAHIVSTQVNPAVVTARAPKDVNLNTGSYDIYVDGVNNQVVKVLFPTWTEYNGQDDLENPWIEGTRVSENTWKITIPFSKHNYEVGKYITDIYAEDAYGNRALIVWRSMTTAHGSVSISQVDLFSASYDIYVYGVAKGATKVEFPTWTENNGQDDIEWLRGQKVTEGVWKATISLNKHNNETGNYITHIYIDGAIAHIVSTQVNPVAVKVRAPKDVNLSAGSYDIYVDGVSNQVAKVQFPTWTEYNGQDDLENPWIEGTRVGENTWKIMIPFSKHNYEPGKYFTDVYAEDVYGNRAIIVWKSVTNVYP